MKIERRFILLIGVSDQCSQQVDNEIDHAAMSCVLNLANVLELIIDRLTQGALAKKYFVKHRQQFFENIAAVAEEFPPELLRQARSGLAIIDVAWGNHHRQQLAAVVDYQV